MKKIVMDFLLRGMVACGFGPIVLAIIYLVLQQNGLIETLTVNQVSIGIFSVAVLAFVAGGINAIYQIERLPLMVAILIHGVVLYCTYLGVYWLNDWLKFGVVPILAFSAIFVIGYFIIWAIIYFIIKRRAQKLNVLLKEVQHTGREGVQ